MGLLEDELKLYLFVIFYLNKNQIINYLKEQSFIEIGAQWMHGTENNPVYDIGVSLDAIDESVGKKNI